MLEETLQWDTAMLVSAIIFTITFVGIFTESVHELHRTKVAMLGAAAMVLAGQFFGFYNPELAIEAIDWNVVFLLGAMMTIVAIMIPTGGFQSIAYLIARISDGRLYLLMIMLGIAVAVISCLLDNVTTVIIFGPLIALICQALSVNPIPFLLSASLFSVMGGVATVVGDPTAMMIGSAAKIDFNTYLSHMLGIVVAAFATAMVMLRFLFRKNFKKVALEPQFAKGTGIQDKKTWFASLTVLAVMVVLFINHSAMHWEPWVVACIGLTMMVMVTYSVNLDRYLSEIELSLLMFFVSLFVIIGGVEQSQFLEYLGGFFRPFVEKDLFWSCIALMWIAAILSAFIDNIPFTAAMIPVIMGMESQGINVTPLWWALAVGAGFGGNGSHLGSTANIFIVTLTERMAKQENKPSLAITPGLWLRKGTPVMFGTLAAASVIMWLFFDFYEAPLPK
ncbi:MAG: arsenic transporter [Rhodospirillales bacterium]|nr:arsenic transporter [Rhodospirillales bacterium]MCB9995769.1 arsenic transporter [Rhodospirillales bacterium]